ncbi:MAG TPA: type II toxin-antitoxin system HicB family antitoxin [archaeon]|nr:type II toxin-antitoxin system HicB family antitoxin [archaeon]
MESKKTMPVSLPIVTSREGKWFIAVCPLLDIATQGKTEKEVRENMEELIIEYFEDPDTPKPSFNDMMSTSVSVINMPVNVRVLRGKVTTVKTE